MSTSIFTTSPDKAYAALGVIPPGQRWFAFDVLMPAARRGEATQFVMAIWNYHSEDDEGKIFRAWGLRQDPETGEYWYRVPKFRAGQDPKNRTSLWNAIHLAFRSGIPMRALLKDRRSKDCAPKFVFPIGDVRKAIDGSMLWLRIDAGGRYVGTEVEVGRLPPMLELDGTGVNTRSPKLTEVQFAAAAEMGEAVNRGDFKRQEAMRSLQEDFGVTEGTASVLLNDYRCLLVGTAIKAPISADAMRHFVDRILGAHGDGALRNVIAALDGYVNYAGQKFGPAVGMREILAELQVQAREWSQIEPLATAARVATARRPPSQVGAEDAAKQWEAESEILRSVWVRGPQHAAFRRLLIKRWGGTCSVHGVGCNDQLRASHIVAWRLDETIRGDVNNGLFLSVPLDSLFDRGLIAFSDDGLMLWSRLLHAETATHFGLQPGLRLRWAGLSERARQAIQVNLARHRSFHSDLHAYVPAG